MGAGRQSGLIARMTLATFRNHLIARIAGTVSRWRGPRVPGAFGILMYHRTAPLAIRRGAPAWNVTPERFAAQIEGLLQAGYQAWPLRKALAYSCCGRPVPRNVFVITFDDGYESVYCWAWPILKQLNVPATVFLATAYLDSQAPFPFDTWAVDHQQGLPAETYRPLSSRQCAEMLEDGHVDLGVHTHTHADFRGRPDALRQELLVSRDVVHARFGLADATFAFPYGFCDPALASAARQAGVLCGLTTRSELVVPRSNPQEWGRFTAEQHDTAATLSGMLDGWYGLARDAWLHLRRAAEETRGRFPRRLAEAGAAGPPGPARQEVLSP
jgi:peptidoglycan/xylan/chitin deacetylase (PgdA/CDA1 family)